MHHKDKTEDNLPDGRAGAARTRKRCRRAVDKNSRIGRGAAPDRRKEISVGSIPNVEWGSLIRVYTESHLWNPSAW